MTTLNIINQLDKASKRIKKPEHILGKGLKQPFNNTNSASRKIMFASQDDQILPLMNPEPALIQTGYEDEFGRYSSSLIVAPSNYEMIAKIPKFSYCPDIQYVAVLKEIGKDNYTIIERKSHYHITESYGYLLNNDKLDSVSIGGIIKKDEVVVKSKAYSEYNNRQDGVNLITAYMTLHETTEDGIVISESAAKKMSAPLIHKVSIIINDNDIPLNLYGDETIYKSFPDIGEPIRNGILCGLRREKKEEALFTLSYKRLQDILISDEKFTLNGTVVDVNIACNNPDGLQGSFYNSQLNFYYNEALNYAKNVIDVLSPIVSNKRNNCSYDLQLLYHNQYRILKGDKWIREKTFTNTVLEIDVLSIDNLGQGDKLTDRYGGKGVVSEVRPDHLMPKLDTGETVEVIFNAMGPVNRENPGQLFELSLNFIGSRLLNMAYSMRDSSDFLQLYLDYLNIVTPSQYKYFKDMIERMDHIERDMFVESIDKGIYLSLEPISESMDLDKLALIYDKFKWITPCYLKVPIKDSVGNVRYVNARRPLIVGKKYMHRLKQYAEDKFSATSLSATNIRNEPTKPKTNKLYKAPYAKTPVRFGEMETGNMLHFLNIYAVVQNLMLHSSSPQGRKLSEVLLTGNPFDINVELDNESKNRNVETLQAYLKTIGLKLVFTKKRKTIIHPISFDPIGFTKRRDIIPISFHKESTINPIKFSSKDIHPIAILPLRFTNR